ncbi:hypothetical protein [Microbacterium sp. CIAB417]|uniref:hypothetical protein n=1 Tax=Microbacterium sp. CIAB417 TaxID=2860287 RepID=UPI001FAE73F3|nr:hypothetical protein [Microbacterium sp. CIAB417]
MIPRTAPIAAALLLTALLVGCTSSAPSTGEESPAPSGTSAPAPGPTYTATPGPVRTPSTITMPTDCRAILSDSTLDLLSDHPLNDKAFAPNGVQEDGTLICTWADPRADTTRLVTWISVVPREPAFEMLNELIEDEGFTCYEPDAGTRCEKTWENEEYPVTDGRTLYWRDDVLIDTRYSNLAPPGYTADIVAHLFADVPTPTPTPTQTPAT